MVNGLYKGSDLTFNKSVDQLLFNKRSQIVWQCHQVSSQPILSLSRGVNREGLIKIPSFILISISRRVLYQRQQ